MLEVERITHALDQAGLDFRISDFSCPSMLWHSEGQKWCGDVDRVPCGSALCQRVQKQAQSQRDVGRVYSLRMLAGDLNNHEPGLCHQFGSRTSTLSLPKQLLSSCLSDDRRLVEAAFSVFDKDGDGKVSLEDFADYFALGDEREVRI